MSETDISVNGLAAPQSGGVDYVALGQAAAKLVHDFKNQLGGLKLYATFLKTRLAHDAESAEIVGKIVQGLDGMAENATLVGRLARPLELRCEPGDLAALARGAATECAALALEREVHLITDCAADLPAMSFDWQQLQQAFVIVTQRALSVAPAHSEVRIGLALAVERITLSVSNAGTPLDATARRQFFAFSTHERLNKTALDLAFAARIVEAHGGAASVSNDNDDADNLTLVQFTFAV